MERWKRGTTLLILTALGLLPGMFAAALVMFALEMFGAAQFATVAGLITFLAIGPWSLGYRRIVRQIGKLAEIAD